MPSPAKVRIERTHWLDRWLRSAACRRRVCSLPEVEVNLSLVRFAGGSGSLGRWGTMWLTGASSAVIKTTHYEDIEVPGEVAEDRPGGIVLLNEAMGRPPVPPSERGRIVRD